MSILGWSGSTPHPDPAGEDLQFEHAEFAAPEQGQSCANCNGPAAPQYHELNGKVFCGACRQRIETALNEMRSSGSSWRAVLYGLGAAIAGSILFYGVSAITGFQFGLIAVVIGWAVGKAVRKGSGSLGGRRYQIMAVLLTYLSIASTNVAPIIKYMSQQSHSEQGIADSSAPETATRVVSGKPALSAASVFLLVGLALALPILNITHDFLGIIIIGIGLWEAWKFTREVKVEFKGPFSIAAASPGAPLA